jgi:hypothetical protein
MTEPELQLLVEDLEDEPTESVLLRVVQELARRGRIAEARQRIRSYLMVDPDSERATALIEMLSAPAPSADTRGRDPFYTVARAEAYLRRGRSDLAMRVYRRVLLDHPGELGLLARLDQLRQGARPQNPLGPLAPLDDDAELIMARLQRVR